MFELVDHISDYLQGMVHSPWLWIAVFLVAGLDALLPFMPSELTVITVAVLVATSTPALVLLVTVAATGALAGDTLGYSIGRQAGPGALARLERGERGRRIHRWAHAQLHSRGDLLLIAGRYIPGVRMPTMLTAGALGFPIRRFLAMDGLGATVWAVYATVIGHLCGATFTDHPAEGLLLAAAIGLVLAALVELGRRLVRNPV